MLAKAETGAFVVDMSCPKTLSKQQICHDGPQQHTASRLSVMTDVSLSCIIESLDTHIVAGM